MSVLRIFFISSIPSYGSSARISTASPSPCLPLTVLKYEYIPYVIISAYAMLPAFYIG